MKITLTPDERSVLNRFNTRRSGGFQNFFRRLQQQVANSPDGLTLTLSLIDIERISRYAFDYGQGGWENRLKEIFERTLGPDLGRSILPKEPTQQELV